MPTAPTFPELVFDFVFSDAEAYGPTKIPTVTLK
jgi:hypothetical protein